MQAGSYVANKMLIDDRLPLEQIGRRVLERTIQWALNDESRANGGGPTSFAAMSDVRVIEEL